MQNITFFLYVLISTQLVFPDLCQKTPQSTSLEWVYIHYRFFHSTTAHIQQQQFSSNAKNMNFFVLKLNKSTTTAPWSIANKKPAAIQLPRVLTFTILHPATCCRDVMPFNFAESYCKLPDSLHRAASHSDDTPCFGFENYLYPDNRFLWSACTYVPNHIIPQFRKLWHESAQVFILHCHRKHNGTYKWRNEGPELRWPSTGGNMCEGGPTKGWWCHPNSRQGACSGCTLRWCSWASRGHAHPLSSTRDQTAPTANGISTLQLQT